MAETLSILIVEDDEVHAINLAAAAEDRSCVVVGPVATVAAALASLETHVDAAVLDANLLDRDVTPVAIALIEKGIPFVIHTGVGLPAELATVFPHVSVIMKPADPDDVMAQLIAQVEMLRGDGAGRVTLPANLTDGADVRRHQIDKIAMALVAQFGDKAIVLARRQAEAATGDTAATWLEIIDHLTHQPAG